LPQSDESAPSARGRELQRQLKQACAIAHGRGYGLSKLDLIELVLEEGLPTRAERERMRREKLASDDETYRLHSTAGLGTTPPSPPPPSD
jgi:hypothetical protein